MVNKNHVVKPVITGAHYGLTDWILQRLTAVIMLAYSIFFLFVLAAMPHDYETWRMIFHNNFVRAATQLTALAIAYHAWIGIRDVCMDYVHFVWGRVVAYLLFASWLVACVIYSFMIIWGVH